AHSGPFKTRSQIGRIAHDRASLERWSAGLHMLLPRIPRGDYPLSKRPLILPLLIPSLALATGSVPRPQREAKQRRVAHVLVDGASLLGGEEERRQRRIGEGRAPG